MNLFIQQIINGLSMGSVYILVGIGLTLVFGILHIPNFAHGALYMLGGYITLIVMTSLGAHYVVAIIASIIVVALIAVLIERLIFHQLREAPPIQDKIAAIGIMLFIEALVMIFWGTDYRRMISPYDQTLQLGSITITSQRILVIMASILVVILLYFFLKKTMIGSSIIAMAQSREGAYLVGINSNVVAMMTFAISGGLAAIAASLAAPINMVFPAMGHFVIMKAFIIVIIGGMGSVPGAIFGGYLLGLTESLAATYISNDYKDLIAFFLLVAILTWKPTGLFAKEVH